MSDDFRYRLYYVPDYPVPGERYARETRGKELTQFIDTITEHVRLFGVLNPIGVFIRHSGIDVRPGKCRVTACQRLGISVIPAIVADYTLRDRPDWQQLPWDAAQIDKFLTRDCVSEVSRRFFSIKKRDIVHRPGVENEFQRDLRLHTKS